MIFPTLELLRDIGLSFAPASARSVHRPYSSLWVVRATIIIGALQAFLFWRWFFYSYAAFLSLRSRQMGSALQHQNGTTQAWFAGVLSLEYLLFHPLGLFLLYLSFEGFIRFVGGLCVSEVVPSLPVVLAFKIKVYVGRKKEERDLEPLASIPDTFEVLPDTERVRISASRAKSRWTANLTIGINGDWYEVEREEEGELPRPYVYILKRASIGKILRTYEEYDLTASVKCQ